MTPNPKIQHMSRLYFFMNFLFMDQIKYVVISETNKRLNSAMNLIEYFRVIGCRLIMACYVGHSARDFFLKDPINLQKGAPIRLNNIISRRRIEKITQVMSYTGDQLRDINDDNIWDVGVFGGFGHAAEV